MPARFHVEQTDGGPGASVEGGQSWVVVWLSLQPHTAHMHSGRVLRFTVSCCVPEARLKLGGSDSPFWKGAVPTHGYEDSWKHWGPHWTPDMLLLVLLSPLLYGYLCSRARIETVPRKCWLTVRGWNATIGGRGPVRWGVTERLHLSSLAVPLGFGGPISQHLLLSHCHQDKAPPSTYTREFPQYSPFII